MRTQGDDIAEVLALIGCEPAWDDASRRVTGFTIRPLEKIGRPRIDVTVRISGFFRDAFPHVIALLDEAICAVAALDEPPESNYLRAHTGEALAAHGDRRRIAVAAKNTDTREHDIADSDDYFQFHGGMVAMVRHLTGQAPAAYIGDSAAGDQVRTRSLAQETRRVFRSRVVNPRWIAAMQRHGYKGAFELAATVDYLFGYDATAGVVEDWMYARLAQAYVFDAGVSEFIRTSNPWALRGIAERLVEAADRGLWASPPAGVLDRLRAVYLELEGQLEGDGE
jgi:cobaltochelatase CobN